MTYKFGNREKRELTGTERIYYNGTRMLTQFYQTGHIDACIHKFDPIKPIVFKGIFEPIANQFLIHKKQLGLSKSGQRQYKRGLFHFFNYCEENSIQSIQTINLPVILQYLNNLDATKRLAIYTALWTLRGFMKYLYGEGIIKIDYSKKIPKYKSTSQPKLPSTYTKEEVEKLISSVDRSTSIGKRNYAFILLAAKLGCRCLGKEAS